MSVRMKVVILQKKNLFHSCLNKILKTDKSANHSGLKSCKLLKVFNQLQHVALSKDPCDY